MHDITLVDQTRAKVAFYHALGLQGLPEPALGLRIAGCKHLIQAVCFHVVNIGPEGQGCYVSGYIVSLHQFAVYGFQF